MTEEAWRPVMGYESAYEVSNLGRVRSLPRRAEVQSRWGGVALRSYAGRLLRPQDNGGGYLCLNLCSTDGRETRLVHRLVAEAFVPRVSGKDFINHLDGDKKNNTSSNLEWCTRSENMYHAHTNCLLRPYVVSVVGTCLRTGRDTYYERQIDAEIALSGTSRPSSAINHCLAGRKKTAYGHVWRLA